MWGGDACVALVLVSRAFPAPTGTKALPRRHHKIPTLVKLSLLCLGEEMRPRLKKQSHTHVGAPPCTEQQGLAQSLLCWRRIDTVSRASRGLGRNMISGCLVVAHLSKDGLSGLERWPACHPERELWISAVVSLDPKLALRACPERSEGVTGRISKCLPL